MSNGEWVQEDRNCRNSLCIFDRFTELRKLDLTFISTVWLVLCMYWEI